MSRISAFFARIAGLFDRNRRDADLTAELEAHLQFHIDDNIRAGMPPEEASRQAMLRLGGLDQTKESYRDQRGLPWLEHMLRDLRVSIRVLAKDPRFSVLAVLGLGLGLGISTAVFALINASANAGDRAAVEDRASYVGLYGALNGRPGYEISYGDYRFYQSRAKSFQGINAESGRFVFVLGTSTASAEAENVEGRFESEDFLSVVGLRPALGRNFSREDALGGSPLAMLNFRFWKQHFGGDEGVVGKTIILNSHVLTIVGVADARFALVDPSDLYLPLELQRVLFAQRDMLHDSRSRWLHLDARLRPGVTPRQAQAELDVLAGALSQAKRTDATEREGVYVSPGGDNPHKREELITLAVVVVIAVSMILLIACSNLANILLARGLTRRREVGIRLSLGATRVRVISLLMTESVLLALAGGATGLLFSHWLAGSLFGLIGAPPGFALQVDPREFVYAFVLSLASAISFGLGPAIAATKSNLAQVMHSEGLSGAPRSKSHRIWAPRNVLVVAPLAVSLLLLMGAAVTLKSMQQRYLGGPSFDTSRLTGLRLQLDLQGYNEARTRQFQESLRNRIATMPGVTSVALATSMPLANGNGSFPLSTEGSVAALGGSAPRADYNVISADFFPTIGAPIVRGRNFTAADRNGSPLVAIVNQNLANTYWNDEDPIGKRIRLGATSGPLFEVIGVASDFEDPNGPFNSVRPTVYVPYGQETILFAGIRTDIPPYQMQFLIHTSGEPSGLKAALRQEVLAQDTSLIVHIQTVQEMLDVMFGPVRMMSMLLSALGAAALIMASVGIYAIMSYGVSQQTREIGIRVALGASHRDILALVMRRTVMLIAWSVVLGLAGALSVDRIFSSVVAGFGGLDVTTCASVCCVLAAVAVLASYVPARKALRVDPVAAMRCE